MVRSGGIMINKDSPVPLYFQIAEELRSLIEDGAIEVGRKIESESEMMQHYGVGRQTIRNALARLVHLGYVRKEHGRGTFCSYSPETGSKGSIDVLLNIQDAYFTPYYLKSISQVLDAEGYSMSVYDTGDDPQLILNQLKRISDSSIGVILQPSRKKSDLPKELIPYLRQFGNGRIPLLMIDSAYDFPRASFMHLNETEGGRIAAKYLLELGHQSLAVVYHEDYQDSHQRYLGFSEIVQTNPECELTKYVYDKDVFCSVIAAVKAKKITAVFCYNDEMAAELLHFMEECGISVPEDVSVMGFDDSLIATATKPPLTSVSHPKQELGREAAKVLIEMIQKRRVGPCQRMFLPGLVVRDSCKSMV